VTRHHDRPGTYEARFEPVAVEGNVAVARGSSRYFKDAPKNELDREFDNVYVLHFDAGGRCAEFREWSMAPPVRAQS